MNCPHAFTRNYLADVLKILESASKLSLQVSNFSDEEEMMNYLATLRETLVDCYTSIVHGVTTSGEKGPLIK